MLEHEETAVLDIATTGIEIECAEEDGGVLLTCSGDAGFNQAEALRRVLFRDRTAGSCEIPTSCDLVHVSAIIGSAS